MPPIPIVEDLHRKVYEACTAEGALEMTTWHSCATTHCRAGWAIHLAGKAGYDLERATSPVFAGMQIYKASGCPISPVQFFLSNEEAMRDIRRCAGVPEVEVAQ